MENIKDSSFKKDNLKNEIYVDNKNSFQETKIIKGDKNNNKFNNLDYEKVQLNNKNIHFENSEYETEEINSLSKIDTDSLYNLKETRNKDIKSSKSEIVENFELTKNIGFHNIGHTCYMNSFLQILLHLPSFLPKLKKYYYNNNIEEDTLIYNLIKLSENPYDSRYLYEIKKTISKTHQKYGSFSQNDSQNFAIDFIDTIINEMKKETSYISESSDESQEISKKELDNKTFKKNKFNKFISDCEKYGKKTFIEELFLFTESLIIYGKDLLDYKKIKFDLLLNIELNFPLDSLKNNYSLYELLDIKYSNSNKCIEKINDKKEKKIQNKGFFDIFKNIFNYMFNICFKEGKKKIDINLENKNDVRNINSINNNIIENKRLSKLTSLPNILIISFDRGIEGKTLISSTISFDNILELKNYIDDDLYDLKLGTTYELFAINIRQGITKSSGHCYSYVKVENDWICFNDSSTNYEKPRFSSSSVVGLYYVKKK